MMSKHKRQEAIKRILGSREVATQGQLLAALGKSRLAANQATLSRDLAELGIHKSGGRYVIRQRSAPTSGMNGLSAGVLGFVGCGPHLIVIRTAVGQAQPVALAIDAAGEPALVGTIAGDDTILVATKSRRTQAVALRRLEQWFGEKHEH